MADISYKCKIVCDAFAKVLKLNEVNPDDDFFAIGGADNTMSALQKLLRIYGIASSDISEYKTPLKISEKMTDMTEYYKNAVQGKNKAPLTDSQLGVYLECAACPESVMYNNANEFIITGVKSISKDELKSKIDEVMKLHPALYAHFETDENGIYMVRDEFPEGGICNVVDAFEFNLKPFNLGKGPLCRINACINGDKLNVYLELHHAVSDGTSFNILRKQICEILSSGKTEPETVDAFSVYEADKNVTADIDNDKRNKYFETLLSDVDTDAGIIPDYKAEAVGIHKAIQFSKKIDISGLEQKLKENNLTKNTLFMGVFGYVITKFAGSESAVISTGESGRKSKLLDNTVSMFVKTLPVVIRPDEEKTGLEYLKELQAQFNDTIAYDTVPFGNLCHNYGVNADNGFVYHSAMLEKTEILGFEAETKLHEYGDAFTKISTMVYIEEGGYKLQMDYRKDLYKAETIGNFADTYQLVLNQILDDKPLKDINLITDEQEVVLDSFNSNEPVNNTATVIDEFRKSAAEYGDKTAVVFKDIKYTYKEFDILTDKLAVYFSRNGIGRDKVVSVIIPRNEFMAIISFAVLKAGGIYEPLDPNYPSERLNFMCEDADTQILVADRNLVDIVSEYNGKVLFTDEIEAVISDIDADDIENIEDPKPDDTYILLYTSGTTGKPKGCMLSHKNLMAFISSCKDFAEITPESKFAIYASYGFDAHMVDLYPSLATGCELHIIPDEIRLNFPELKNYFETNGITNCCMTTQVARQFASEYDNIKGLKYIICGGEKLLPYPLNDNFRLINCYGPTECTICVTDLVVDKQYEDIPIGKPMKNNHIFVCDKYGRRLPVCAPGELIICGPQVGKGYLNRKEQTDKVFVPNTYEKNPDYNHLRCYKTGDIVRYIPDGNIEYIGRRDFQVKIRGYRIELSEIEKVIREYKGIKNAVVIAVDENGGKSIHAYIVSDEKIDINELNKFIKSQKPAYMVPAATMQIDSIPLTVNQKVDKRKLPPIEAAKREVSSAPRQMNNLEKAIADILKEVVGDVEADAETEFTYLGVTSISSIKLSTKIYKKFGVNISSSEILDGGSILTVENTIISSLLEKSLNSDSGEEKKTLSKYPLTQVQMGIYLDSMRAGMGAYNIPLILKLTADINRNKLKIAIINAVKAHPSMLCYIHPDENGDVAIYPQGDMSVEIFEEKSDTMPPESFEFKFDKEPLFRISILEYKNIYYLYILAHHIIADGESLTILLDDINRAYCGETISSENYTIFNLAIDEQSARSSGNYAEAKAYYDSVFKGVSADYLPVSDKNEETVCSMFGYSVNVSPFDIKAFCNKNGITENIFFTGVFANVLAKFTGHEDALFSTIYNGRTDPRTERLAAMLVKTLPLFVQTSPEIAVADYFKAIENNIKQLRKYDIFSFADAAKEYSVNADIIFVYQGRMMSSPVIGNKSLEQITVKNDNPKAEISAEVFEYDGSYGIEFEYNGGHFSEELIKSIADAYATCVANIIGCEKLGDVEILSKDAFEKFDDFNNTDIDVEFKPIYRFFEEQAAAHPQKAAVIARSEKDNSVIEKLTYDELNNMSNFIAHQLIDTGIKPESPVALMTGRSKEVIVSIHGILKAGCPFLFLSPSYPDDRIEYIAEESCITAIVTTHLFADERKELFDKLNIKVLFADDVDISVKSQNTGIDVSPDALAYLIYTSGSTGKPKGVMVKQKGIVNLSDGNSKNIQMNKFYTDVFASVSAYTFDASVIDTVCCFRNGSTLVIASDEDIHNPMSFTEMALENGIKGICCTPSFMISLLEYPGFAEVVEQMEAVLCGGEAFPPSLYEKLYVLNPNLRIINGYGPSETTIACTAKLLEGPDNITIGTPLNNYKIHIIDKQNHILPMGALGELIISGIGVGKGYLNRDDLTKKSFIKLLGEDAYKSGDLALITHTGEIEFHGRIDNQVKLRGLRIELGEIENAINSCDGVKTSIVVVSGKDNNQFLAAYYTAEKQIDSAEITDKISKTLAEYMVPRVLIQLDSMPLTANGKINKKELPEPVAESKAREYKAPETDTEKSLCEAFEKALGLEKVGINDDFFELGGTSLTATKVAMFALSHGINIAYKDVFTNPTVKELAQLTGTSDAGETDTFDDDYTLTDKALGTNIWHPGDDAGYRPLGNILITGATGFLGMHVLKEFLENEEGDVYCLLRAGSFTSPELKLTGMFIYYFDSSIEYQIGKRIHCIDGDITDRNQVIALKDVPFDTLINCAACVKHFANGDILDKVNVEGVKNLADMCLESGKRLIHVSTISVAGEGMNGNPDRNKKLCENELYFGQNLENQYIISKFKSEKIVLDAVTKGLDGKIMRAGNLMPRHSDGEFQINYMTNGFMRRLRGYYVLGCIPYSQLSGELEFSPIDETAAAMLALAKTDKRFSVFHANNIHKVYISDVIRAMNKAGLNVECVDEDEFAVRLKTAMENSDSNSGVSGLIAYLNRDSVTDRYMLGYDNSFTASVLNRIGFNWNITDDNYVVNSLEQVNMLGFFELGA